MLVLMGRGAQWAPMNKSKQVSSDSLQMSLAVGGGPMSWGGCTVRSNASLRTPLYPCERKDRHLWKHYFPATSLVGGNRENCLWTFLRKQNQNFLTCLHVHHCDRNFHTNFKLWYCKVGQEKFFILQTFYSILQHEINLITVRNLWWFQGKNIEDSTSLYLLYSLIQFNTVYFVTV